MLNLPGAAAPMQCHLRDVAKLMAALPGRCVADRHKTGAAAPNKEGSENLPVLFYFFYIDQFIVRGRAWEIKYCEAVMLQGGEAVMLHGGDAAWR